MNVLFASNFPVIGLCSSSANSLLCMISFLTAPLTVFLSKLDLFDVHHILDS